MTAGELAELLRRQDPETPVCFVVQHSGKSEVVWPTLVWSTISEPRKVVVQ